MEEWKNIEGFDGYQVSNYGRVKSFKRGKEKILKGRNNGNGYLQVCLCQDGKLVFKRIHRLVAQAFLPNPNNLPQVNHKDENKTNNCVENLEWCDSKYNSNYGTRTERCSRRVDQINAVTGQVVCQWLSTKECSRNGFDSGNVSRCARGKLKQYKGFIWKYIRE